MDTESKPEATQESKPQLVSWHAKERKYKWDGQMIGWNEEINGKTFFHLTCVTDDDMNHGCGKLAAVVYAGLSELLQMEAFHPRITDADTVGSVLYELRQIAERDRIPF